jgi:hypothetical protein
MLCAKRLTLQDTRPNAADPMLAMMGTPPLLPRTAGGLSGRPRCRIYPVGRLWVLQVERGSGWPESVEPPPRLEFPKLAAAVSFAEQHGYDYRIIIPTPVSSISERAGRGARRQELATTRQINSEN